MPLESRHEFIELAKISPTNFLNYGPKPILIDEWQHVSFIWDQVKYEIDKTGDSNGAVSLFDLKNGKFNTAMSKKDINDYAYYTAEVAGL